MNSGNTETLKSLSRFIKKILNNVGSSWLFFTTFTRILHLFSFFRNSILLLLFCDLHPKTVYIYICTSCISDLVFSVNKEWKNWGQFNFFMFLPLWYSDIITTYDVCWSSWMTGLKKNTKTRYSMISSVFPTPLDWLHNTNTRTWKMM